MKVEWNQVTWYSKLLALALFVVLLFAAFWLGVHYGEATQYTTDLFAGMKNTSSSALASQSTNPYYENVSAWQTDENNGGWSIAYPLDFDTTDYYAPVD